MTIGKTSGPEFGTLLRQWRTRERLSQRALAARVGCSTRHLNFIENGRANPGRELVLRLTGALGMKSLDSNRLLVLAGYAEAFQNPEPAGGTSELFIRWANQVLAGSMPAPAAILDTRSRVVRMNRSAAEIFAVAADIDEVWDGGLFSFILGCLHPDGTRSIARDWEPYAEALIQAIVRDRLREPETFDVLLRKVRTFKGIRSEWAQPSSMASAPQIIPLHIKVGEERISLRIPTLELRVAASYAEPLYPGYRLSVALPENEESRDAMRRLGARVTGTEPHPRFKPYVVEAPDL
ncbi:MULTISPECIES: helix-turn-helix domain-containing protein [Hyphobacterium]|uniref:Helix-turn-helix domain-containing protein n=1 Tax=Hyphobacterium vulgare TaxID=1736751 RepID=A0ABV6ZTN0_9PROT